MRISALVLALLVVIYTGCNKSTSEPTPIPPVEPEPALEVEKPDTTKYPLIGEYAWRVVSHEMIRAGSTTINNWDLTMRFMPTKVRYTYNGGAITDYPTTYNGDTVKIAFRADSTVTFWKSLHSVEGKYEWHIEGANCRCVNSVENFDVYHLRR